MSKDIEYDSGKAPWRELFPWDYDEVTSAIVGDDESVDSVPIAIVLANSPHNELIIAAPRLFAFCKEIKAAVDNCDDFMGINWEELADIIAKVEGGKSE